MIHQSSIIHVHVIQSTCRIPVYDGNEKQAGYSQEFGTRQQIGSFKKRSWWNVNKAKQS